MDLAALNIKIGADLSELDRAVPKFNADVSAMANTVAKTNTKLDQSSKSLAKFAAETAAVSGGMAKTTSVSNSATLALNNLGRVAQDLPFGFIGISNNLNPLLEGFQRLSAESKAAGTSVTSVLLKSLTGAGGLGLALSVVSAALTFASFGMSAWTRGFGSNKKAVDEAKDSLKGYLEEASKSLLNFKELTAVAADLNAPLKERKKALEDLRSGYTEYLKNLSDEQILAGQLGNAYKAVNEALLAKLTLESAEEKIKPILQEILDLQLKNADAQKIINLASQNQLDTSQKLTLAQRNLVINLQNNGKFAEKAVADNNKQIDSLNIKLNNLLANLGTTIAKGKEFDLTQGIDKSKKSLESIADILAKLKLELSAINARELAEGLNLSSEKINKIEDVINKLIVDFKVPTDSTLISKLFGDINDIKFGPANFKEFIDKLQKTIAVETVPAIPVEFKPVVTRLSKIEAEASLIRMREALQKAGQKVFSSQGILSDIPLLNDAEVGANFSPLQQNIQKTADLATSVLGPAFEAVFNAIADGQNVMQALGQSIKQLVVKITAAALEAAVLSLIINSIFGGGSVSFGSLFSSLAGIPKFAGGGVVPSGFPNDTYPALLTSGEAVIPAGKLDKYMSPQSSNMHITVSGELKGNGNAIVAAIKKATVKYNNTY